MNVDVRRASREEFIYDRIRGMIATNQKTDMQELCTVDTS